MVGSIVVSSQRHVGVKPPNGYHLIHIDRPSGSILQNTHFMASEAKRALVISRFADDLHKDFILMGPMWTEIYRIRDMVRLGKNVALHCWCAPKPCHGDLIKQAIEDIL